jgi:hypothetical protein
VKSVIAQALLAYIPFLKGNFVEQRQWTIRRRVRLSPAPARCALPTPILSPAAPRGSPDPPTPAIGAGRFEVLGIPELGKDFTEPADDDTAYNFITDPCCCCPIHWARNEGNVEDLFKFA